MNPKALLLSAIALLLTPKIAIAAPALTEESRLGTNGIGPLQVGMTLREAEAASGRTIKLSEDRESNICKYATILGIEGINVMFINGIIERVDISNPRILTLRSAQIGDSENRIKELYQGHIKTTPHPYGRDRRDHYLTFYPKDREDQDYRLIFETRKNKVNSFRGGRLPAVDYIEGCL